MTNGANTTTRYYAGAFEYEGSSLKLLHHGEGRVRVDGTTYTYDYYLKDHLGNTMVCFTKGSSGQAQVLQSQSYYPFGMSFAQYESGGTTNRLLYNGKEYQNDLGLNLYDYGARFYDAAIGRWHVVDKLAEEPNQIFRSPYQFAWNNPIKLNDPDGNCPWMIIGAVVGAAVDYSSQVALNYASGKESPWTNVNGASIITSAIAGAATGGLASVARTGAITTTRAVAGSMAVNAGESISKQMGSEGTVNPTQVVIDVAVGQIADGISTKNLVPTKQLENQLDRTMRVAGENPRVSRAEAVNVAQEKVNAVNNINQAFSVTQAKVAENAIGATSGAITSSSRGNNTPTPVVPPLIVPVDNTRVNLPIIRGL